MRLSLVFTCVTLGWIILAARFVQIQIVEGSRCESLVADQCWGKLKLTAKRGCIYDCNGKLLAFDMPSETFYTYTFDKSYLSELARRISSLTGETDLVRRVLKRPGKFNTLARFTSPELAAKIKALNCDSIYSYPEFLRVYRYHSLGEDILGQIDVDNNGISGIEVAYDKELKPVPGVARFQRDGKGRVYRISDTPIVRPHDGCEIKLTIDIEYQQIVEEELRRAVDKWNAKSGMAVFIEAATGRVLAADYYSPLTDADNRVFKSRFVTDLFEPGSTFKLVAFAGMLEDHLFSLRDTIWAGMGKFEFNGRILHDDKELGTITFRRAFELSSNIATSRFSQALGGKKLFKYARQFGFGQCTGIDIPGEEHGRLEEPRNWSKFWTAQSSIGHGISVTALQMAAAIGSIANDGVLMRPYVVEEIRTETGRLKKRSKSREIRRVVSHRTAMTLQDLMAGVVDSGTAEVARIEEVLFSGKTGTAQKPNLETGGYYWNKYTASFGGFFPREEPRIAGIVVIDEPQRVNYGGYTAAPAFAETARRITLLEKTRKDWARQQAETGGNTRESARVPRRKPGPAATTEQTSEMVQRFEKFQWWISEKDKTTSTPSSEIDDRKAQLCRGVLPDLTGLPARDAVILLSNIGCSIEIDGNGKVENQNPAAGSKLEDVKRIVLACKVNTGGKHQTQ
jgi:cell division protein FtsI (penicillin-binding protein 3)